MVGHRGTNISAVQMRGRHPDCKYLMTSLNAGTISVYRAVQTSDNYLKSEPVSSILKVHMAAFDKLDWSRLDVCAILAGSGVAVVEPERRETCLAWLRKHDYTVTTIDFVHGIGSAVVTMGELFRWEKQFGYALTPESRNLDALRDGFEFDLQPGRGAVLELLHAEVAQHENPIWFRGLLSIASEYSQSQLALGARFFAVLVLPRDSKLIGLPYDEVAIPNPFSTPARHGGPFSDSAVKRPDI